MSSHNFALRERTPTPVGILYRLTKSIGKEMRIIWSGKDLNEMSRAASSIRSVKLPWWKRINGGKTIIFKLEHRVDGVWEECEDARFHR
jgi:hypothetical protein